MIYTVKKEFRSASNFTEIHEVGEDVSYFEPAKIAHLTALGLIQEKETEEEKNAREEKEMAELIEKEKADKEAQIKLNDK